MTRKRFVRPGFEQRVLASLRGCGIDREQRLVVGFSGGPDSLALALALRRIVRLVQCDVLLVHVDHRLRPDSASNAMQCRTMAEDIGFSFELAELSPGLIERSSGHGIEEQARRERYIALGLAASRWNSRTLLLGHQANDQAETVLLHLIRGSGVRGLSGMRLVETRPIPWWDKSAEPIGEFQIARPMLGERRETIEAYLDELGASPLLDESNLSADFDRNWMRHQVMPAILQRWSGAIETIGRTAATVRLDSDYLEEISNRTEHSNGDDDRTLCTDELLGAELALAYRSIAGWLRRAGVDEPGSDVVARVYRFVCVGDRSALLGLGSGVIAVLSGEKLLTLADLLDGSNADLPMRFPDGRIDWRIEVADDLEDSNEWVQVAYSADLEVRTLRPGDCWSGTRRNVMDDLRAAGVHPLVRPHLLAIADVNGVLLIPAIYPTIHSKATGRGTRKGWIRWSKER